MSSRLTKVRREERIRARAVIDSVKATHERMLEAAIALGDAGAVAAVRHQGAIDALEEVRNRYVDIGVHARKRPLSQRAKPASSKPGTECPDCKGEGAVEHLDGDEVIRRQCGRCRGLGRVRRRLAAKGAAAQLKRECGVCGARPLEGCITEAGVPLRTPHRSR